MRYWIVSVEGRANGKKNIRLFNGSFMIKRFFFSEEGVFFKQQYANSSNLVCCR